MKVNTALVVLVGVLLFGFADGHAQPKGYPSKPIQIVVATTAGGGIDMFFRTFADELTKLWKVPVTVVNQPGAMGAMASNQVINAKKDGYTLLGILVTQLAVMTRCDPKGPINLLRDFDPILTNMNYAAAMLVVKNDSKFKTFRDVTTYAKERPGELIVATPAIGTDHYLYMLLFQRALKNGIRILPFAGGSQVLPQVLGGHVPLGILSDAAAKPNLDSGKLRAFVCNTRSRLYPDIPTFAESGYPEVNLFASMVLLGPKGLPADVMEKWQAVLGNMLNNREFIDRIQKLGYKTNFETNQEKNGEFFKEEIEKVMRFSTADLVCN